ncbi:TPA: hypothetical protein N0F65_002375, partial [Lagenidium giganteum]
FKEYRALVERFHSRNIQRLVIDNEGEFVSTVFSAYCKAKIKHFTTVAHTPEQNDMIESRSKQLLGQCRSVLIDGNLLKQSWAHCVQCLVYLYNRTVCRETGKTPFELWKCHKV